jgi:hypothetical protein
MRVAGRTLTKARQGAALRPFVDVDLRVKYGSGRAGRCDHPLPRPDDRVGSRGAAVGAKAFAADGVGRRERRPVRGTGYREQAGGGGVQRGWRSRGFDGGIERLNDRFGRLDESHPPSAF